MPKGFTLSNGREIKYVLASGAMGHGKGWTHEQLLVAAGLIDLGLFATVIKTAPDNPRTGNLRWWKPLECMKPIPGGWVNKVDMTHPGIEWWCRKVAPGLKFKERSIIASIYGSRTGLVGSTEMLHDFDLAAIEINKSCPNAGALPQIREIVGDVRAVCRVSRHPVIVKVSICQPYLDIARALEGYAEAITFNSVPWEIYAHVYARGQRSPLWRLEDKVGGGGGGVSGGPAQAFVWAAANELVHRGPLKVIFPSMMCKEDVYKVERHYGAEAVSFATIHLPTYPLWAHPFSIFTNPCKPTRIVREIEANNASRSIK